MISIKEDVNVYVNEETRDIIINDVITDKSCSILYYYILKFINEDSYLQDDSENRVPICIHINSFGGSYYDVISILNLISICKTPVITYCTGYALSCGFLLFLAGDQRYCCQNSILMYHQIRAELGEITHESLKSENERLGQEQEEMEEYIISRTGITRRAINVINSKQKDYYFTHKEITKFDIANILEYM